MHLGLVLLQPQDAVVEVIPKLLLGYVETLLDQSDEAGPRLLVLTIQASQHPAPVLGGGGGSPTGFLTGWRRLVLARVGKEVIIPRKGQIKVEDVLF